MKKSIVFDFGMVLISWSPYFLYRKMGLTDDAIREFLEEIKYGEFNLRLDEGYPFARWEEEYSLKFPHRKELIHAFHTRWSECSAEPIEGAVQIMRELKALGHPVYGLSNWSAESFEWIKHRYAFLNELDDFLLSGMVGVTKPKEQIYRLFLSRVGKKAEECIFIDDMQVNLDGASRLGFGTLLFTTPDKLRSDLVALGLLS